MRQNGYFNALASSRLVHELQAGTLFARNQGGDDPFGIIGIGSDLPALTEGLHLAELSPIGRLTLTPVEPHPQWGPVLPEFDLSAATKRQFRMVAPHAVGCFEVFARRAPAGRTPNDGLVTVFFGVMSANHATKLGLKSEHLSTFALGEGVSPAVDFQARARGLNLHQVFHREEIRDPVTGKCAYGTTSPEYLYAMHAFNLGLAKLGPTR